MKHTVRTIVFLSFVTAPLLAQVYVSPTGDDSNPGTFDQPYKTITKAYSVVSAGDTILMRGGVYDSLLTTINLQKSGSSSAWFYLLSYPGERPILDFSQMAVSSSNRGMRISGSYWYVRGIDIKGAGDNGMHISGNNNIVEDCAFYENKDTGLQLSNGASNNQIINCDSYFNCDPGQGNADGFAPKLDVGTGNSFSGCRAWQNSDDGWDGYMRGADDVSTTLTNCWSFKNGYLKDGSLSSGNGNGFKMGGSDDKTLRHNMVLNDCVAFDNKVKGFDQNNNRGSMTINNGTAYRNGLNYSIPDTLSPGKSATVTNCVALGSYGSLNAVVVQTTNSWQSPFVVNSSDFQSTDTAGVRGSRGGDGSLPDLPFMHLAAGSDLIDAGTDVGLPYFGTAPDLGAFESSPPVFVARDERVPQSFFVSQNYPNPFNPETKIAYYAPRPGVVTLRLYDVVGRLVKSVDQEISVPGSYEFRWNGTDATGARVPSGVYLAVVQFESMSRTLKLQLLK